MYKDHGMYSTSHFVECQMAHETIVSRFLPQEREEVVVIPATPLISPLRLDEEREKVMHEWVHDWKEGVDLP